MRVNEPVEIFFWDDLLVNVEHKMQFVLMALYNTFEHHLKTSAVTYVVVKWKVELNIWIKLCALFVREGGGGVFLFLKYYFIHVTK